MIHLFEFEKYDPTEEYKEDSRRDIDLEKIRKSQEYEDIIGLGFKDTTSHQQEINNTLKLERKRQPIVRGFSKVFYTIHPTGSIRRYNPKKSDEMSEGQGNTIKKYPSHFKSSREYTKALRFLFNYLKKKEEKEDLR